MSNRTSYELSRSSIACFLHYGYIPEVNAEFFQHIIESVGNDKTKVSPNEYGGGLLCEIVKEAIAKHSQEGWRLNVVPLSGGLDSRAILGALLNCVEARDIVTVTFGSPGALDYEIGKRVAKAVGVEHVACDLTSNVWKWDTSDLVNIARPLSSPIWIFDRYVNDVVGRIHQNTGVYWSGFMGDPIAGSHLRSEPSKNWVEARQYFSAKNKFDNSNSLAQKEFIPFSVLPPRQIVESNIISFDEQLDFAVRQGSFIKRVIESPGCKYEFPFLDMRWIASSLRLASSHRLNQKNYKAALVNSFPSLFSLPTKTYQGAPLSASYPRLAITKLGNEIMARLWRVVGRNYKRARAINYIDFDEALRDRKELRELARLNLADLKARQVCDWIDIDGIWKSHENGTDLGRAITLLISLEIYFKASERR